MISNLEEFRCPDFVLVDVEGHFHLFYANDTIGERITRDEAMARVMTRLGDPPTRPSRMPAMASAYRRKVTILPRHVDDSI